MKVLQIISGNDNGGGGNHVLNLCYYSKQKFECVMGTIGSGYLYENSIKKGIATVEFSNKAAINGEIINYIKENNVDLVNFHGAKAFFMHYFLRNKLNIPSIATVHSDYRKDFLNSRVKHLLFTPLSVLGLKSFKNYICMSKYIKDLLDRDKLDGCKFLVNNGMDFENIIVTNERENLRKEFNIDLKDFVYVNVARMHPIKNQENLINAFGKLSGKVRNVKLLIIGDGPLEDNLKTKVKDIGLENKVIFTGFRKNVLDFINAGDVSILTSFNEGGAPPLVLLESGAVKKAFISSMVGDMKYIIDSNCGFLVDPNSVEDIYEKMKSAFMNREETKIKGENLYKLVHEKYSIDTFCNQYKQAYDSLK